MNFKIMSLEGSNGKKFTQREEAIDTTKIFSDGENESWMKNPEIVKEVQRLSKQLESDLIADKRPLPSLDPDKLTKREVSTFLRFRLSSRRY